MQLSSQRVIHGRLEVVAEHEVVFARREAIVG